MGVDEIRAGVFGGDAYCVCEVPQRKKHCLRTPVIKNSANPTWGHVADLMLSPGDSLRFTVFHEGGCEDTMLGTVTAEPSSFLPYGYDGPLVLQNTGKGVQSTLIVKIERVPSDVFGGDEDQFGYSSPENPLFDTYNNRRVNSAHLEALGNCGATLTPNTRGRGLWNLHDGDGEPPPSSPPRTQLTSPHCQWQTPAAQQRAVYEQRRQEFLDRVGGKEFLDQW